MNLYDIKVQTMRQEEISLKDYENKVILIVNTASSCGFTPQFKGLETLYQKYKDQNFIILGFPCNQFLNQDPKSNEEILSFCQLNFGVTFPMFAKIDVNGKNQSPLYQYLKSQQKGTFNQNIKWNFTKFLISSTGEVTNRFGPSTTPEELEPEILSLLEKT